MGWARLGPLAAGTLLLGGCAPTVSQIVAQNRAGAGLIWAGVIVVLILAILSVIRWLHAKGAAWQVTYLGANLTAAMGIYFLFAIIGAALLPASIALRAVGVGATVGAAWFVLSAVSLAPEDSDSAGLFWFFLGRNGRSRRAPTQKQPQRIPSPYPEKPKSAPAEPECFRSPPPQLAPEPQQAPQKAPLVVAPAVTHEFAPAVAMSFSPAVDNRYVPECETKSDANPDDHRRCPHGHRRREYCPICDLEGFRENFGDWRTD